jgi:hypothetical protein
MMEKNPKDIKDPYARRDALVEERKQQHRDHIQDIYNKTHKVIKDRMDEREEKTKLTV